MAPPNALSGRFGCFERIPNPRRTDQPRAAHGRLVLGHAMGRPSLSIPFRNTAAFGKRIEYYVVGLMLKEGLDVYLPLVDDDAIDAVVKRPDGRFVEVQIKARSKTAAFGNAALFAALTHELRGNYWFVFYSERMDTIWIMSSAEFVREAHQNKSGQNAGKRTIGFNGKDTRNQKEHCRPQFQKYVATGFRRILEDDPDKPFDE